MIILIHFGVKTTIHRKCSKSNKQQIHKAFIQSESRLGFSVLELFNKALADESFGIFLGTTFEVRILIEHVLKPTIRLLLLIKSLSKGPKQIAIGKVLLPIGPINHQLLNLKPINKNVFILVFLDDFEDGKITVLIFQFENVLDLHYNCGVFGQEEELFEVEAFEKDHLEEEDLELLLV
jgi:hypothetical protein